MMGAFDDLIPFPSAAPAAGGYAERLLGLAPRVTTYSPQRGGDAMEGGYEASRRGPDGQAVVRTLEDFRTGASPYVTIAGNPSLYGREYTVPEVTYAVGGQRHTLRDVPVVVHDTGGAFRNAPEGRFDVPIGRDLGARDTNQGLSGVQFVPRSGRQAMAYTAELPRPAGVQAIEGAIRPVPGADPIPPMPQVFAGQQPARPWQDGSVQQMPAPPVQQPHASGLFDDLIPNQPQQASAGLFDDLIPSQPQGTQPAPSGLWNNLTAGANDMIYSTLGAPVDLAAGVWNAAARQARALSGAPVQEINDPLGGSRSIARGFEGIGVNDPAKVQANSTGEKLARAAGTGIGGMIAPEAALGTLNRAGVVGEGAMNAIAPFVGRSASMGDVATNAAVGAAAGVGGQMAGQVVPEPWKPLAETVGGMVGGGLGVGAIAAGRGAAQLPQAWRDFRLSGVPEQERAAGQRLWDAASDPYAAREAIDTAPRELVPGSQPTTFQQTGDMGLGGLERAVATRNPEAFQQLAADQNSARLTALRGLQPNGAPEQVVTALRQNLADLDASTGQALEAATATAREAAGRIGGEGVPEGYGFDIRQQIMDARGVAKERERALWRAVDPDGSLTLHAMGTRDMARDTVANMPKLAEPMAGVEASVFSQASHLPDVVPFRELTEMRSRVSKAMTDARLAGDNRVLSRLSQLRGAIERDIEGAVANKAAQEERAVQAGVMSEEDTIAAMLARMEQQRGSWYDDRTAALQMGNRAAEDSGGYVSGGSGRVSPAPGGKVPQRGVPNGAPRDQGVQGPGLFPDNLAPNFDEGAAGRLKAASAATRERAQTFDAGRVGGVTKRSGAQGPFLTEASVVPGRFFVPGPRGFEAMQSLRNAAPEAMAQVRDYAVSTLRRDAMLPDGTLDPARVQRWRQKHADALRAIPEVDQMLANPVQASETMARIALGRKQQMDAFQQGAVARLLNLDYPADVTRMVGGIFSRQDSVQQMARLARETADNEEAKQGLRKAVADYINQRFISNTEAATSGEKKIRADPFQGFMTTAVPALRRIFSDGEIMVMHAIANDISRANRTRDAVRIPGQSNTAQDTAALAKGTDATSWLARILSPGALAGAGAAAGSTVGGGWGAAAGGAAGAHFGRVIEAMRQAGLQSVDDIVKDAMLNPDRARALLAKVDGEPSLREAISLARVYMRSLLAPDGGGEQQEAPPPAADGRLRLTITPSPLPAANGNSMAERLMGVGP